MHFAICVKVVPDIVNFLPAGHSCSAAGVEVIPVTIDLLPFGEHFTA